MLHNVIAILDLNTNTYLTPNYLRSAAAFLRQIGDDLNAPDIQPGTIADTMAKHPEDFEIHLLGSWDDETGGFEPLPADKRRIARVLDLKK